MKIYIGPYKNWWGPYQIADLLQKVGLSEERCEKIGEYLSTTWFSSFCEWVETKKKRKIKIKIHKYDTWNMDHTLALIILPMLKQLKATNHGSQIVDDCDVPKELGHSSHDELDEVANGESRIVQRWNWVQDEMIWAFEQIVDERLEWEISSKDLDAYNAYHARIDTGLRLFGKYYRGLWD